jgi:hypothetical protein
MCIPPVAEQCHGMTATDIIGEVFFQRLVFRPRGNPARAQDLLYRGNFLIADTGAREGKKSLTHAHLLAKNKG